MATTPLSDMQPVLSSSLQPFALEPVLVERIWGTDDLQDWSAKPTAGKPIGEIWLTSEDCKVANGPMAGSTLAEVTAKEPEALGDAGHVGFPLLIKLLFPREKLSVQVHPNDEEAQLLGMPRGKTECWYVLSAEPGAEVAVGFKEALSREQVRAAIEDGSIEGKLRMLPVQAGDMVFVDAGTIHAIGPGMVVLETQQYSDTTYRLWDYGRPRELHIEAGTAVTRPETAAGKAEAQVMEGYTRLVTSDYFTVDRFDLDENVAGAMLESDNLQIVIALSDACSMQASNGETVPLPRAEAVVVPGGSGSYLLQGGTGSQIVRILQP